MTVSFVVFALIMSTYLLAYYYTYLHACYAAYMPSLLRPASQYSTCCIYLIVSTIVASHNIYATHIATIMYHKYVSALIGDMNSLSYLSYIILRTCISRYSFIVCVYCVLLYILRVRVDESSVLQSAGLSRSLFCSWEHPTGS